MKIQSLSLSIPCIACCLLFSSTVNAIQWPDKGPLDFNSGSYAMERTSGGGLPNVIVVSGDQSGSNGGFTGQSDYYVRLSDGMLGSKSTITAGSSVRSSFVQSWIFDTIMFDFGSAGSGVVSYGLEVFGSLANSGANAIVGGAGMVEIADVTGLPGSFHISGDPTDPFRSFLQPNSASVSAEPELVETNPAYVSEVIGGHALVDPLTKAKLDSGEVELDAFDSIEVSSDGIPVDFSKTLSDSFVAQNERRYAIMVGLYVEATGTGAASADLLGTATFGFTDLSGGYLTSDSGKFPGSGSQPPPATVPDAVATSLLLALSFPILLLAKKRGWS